MTVETQITKVKYTGDGAAKDFPVNFPVTANQDVKAIITNSGIDTTLVYGTDYSFTPGATIGGTLTTTVAVASGATITIYLDTPALQGVDFENTGFVDLKQHEAAYDKLTLLVQQLRESVSRSVKVGITSTSTPDQLVDLIVQSAAQTTANKLAVDQALGNLFRFPIPQFTTVDGQLDYILPYPADTTSNNVFLSLGGLPQQPGVDFTLPAPTTLRFASNPGVQVAWGMITLSLSNPDIQAEIDALVNLGKADFQAFLDTVLPPSGALGIPAGGTGANTVAEAQINFGVSSTPTANAIPKADANGTLNDWLTRNAINYYLHVRDEKPSGTTGGSSSAGWNTRDLNTVKNNTIPDVSLSANRIALPAGTYFIEGYAPAYSANAAKSAIYDYTHSAYLLFGQQLRADNSYLGNVLLPVRGKITLTETTVIELRMYAASTTTYGLGSSAAIPGIVEVFSEVFVWKM